MTRAMMQTCSMTTYKSSWFFVLTALCSGCPEPVTAGADTVVDPTADIGDTADGVGLDVQGDGPVDAVGDGPVDAVDDGVTDVVNLDGVADTDMPPPSGIFVEGCPEPGKAYAKQIETAGAQMEGPHAMAGEGDWLLMNEHAAFAITDPSFRKSYWYYDGILVDAVPVAGCAQAGLERFEELVPILAQMNLADFSSSVIRGFRVDFLEVLADGSDGGEAIIRAHGVDDLFWLIDQVLAEGRFKAGNGDGLSKPLGLEVWVDYILAPGSSVLKVQMGVQNIEAEPKELGSGLAVWPGDTTTPYYYADTALSVGGFDLDLGAPWLASESFDGDGAYAIALNNANAATASISGVQAFLDVGQALAMPTLGPVGAADDTLIWEFYVAVGATDGNSATRALAAEVPKLLNEQTHTLEPVQGTVVDSVSGAGVADVTVTVEKQNSGGNWATLDRFRTDADGAFGGELLSYGGESFRLVASKLGMPTSEPVALTLPAASALSLPIVEAAFLQLDVRGSGGAGLPCRVMLYDAASGGERRRILSATGGELVAVAPGEYEVSVLRGIEFSLSEQTVTLVAGETATLTATLERIVDTTGFLLMDSHVHGGPSADSRVLVADRIITAAADGCEVPVNTDHEFILDYKPTVAELGLTAWVRQVTGEEVTPTLPEHINMFPVVPTIDEDARGGIVKWYGLDIAEIFAAIDERSGGGIRQLNHPRNGCNFLCTIGYDRLTGEATKVPDPTLLGFAPGAVVWSWDFDAIELMNGFGSIWLDPGKPDSTGLFEDWQSFFNLGHRITAMGVTDTHGIRGPCQPGTFFESSTDDPAQLDEQELVASIRQGRALLTTGAFARVSVNGSASMGDTVTDMDGSIDVAVKIEAIPQIDVAYFKVFVNCDEVANIVATAPDAVVKYDDAVAVAVTADANVVVVGFGTKPMPRGFDGGPAATTPRFLTNPVFIDTDGNGVFDAPGGKSCVYSM